MTNEYQENENRQINNTNHRPNSGLETKAGSTGKRESLGNLDGGSPNNRGNQNSDAVRSDNGQSPRNQESSPQDTPLPVQIGRAINPDEGINRLSKDYPFTEPDNSDLRALCRTFQHVLASSIEVAYEWGTKGTYPDLITGGTDAKGRLISRHGVSMNIANRILYRLEYERDNDGEYTYSAHFTRLLADLNTQLNQAAKILEYSGSPKGLSFSEAAINYLKSIGGNKQ